MSRPWIPLACAAVVALAACGTAAQDDTGAAAADADGCVDDFDESADYFPDKVEADYAQHWDVRYENHYKVLTTDVDAGGGHAAVGSRDVESTYVLLQCGAPEPELTGDLADATVIEIPTATFVDGGSVLYAPIERLGLADALVGHAEAMIGEAEALHLPQVAARIEDGIPELDYEVNYEELAETDPDFYTNYAGDDAMFDQIEQLGIPIVYYFPYSESPLGAAEQVKFLSLFFNAEAEANDVFDPIEEDYLDLRETIHDHAAALDEPPTVLIGVVGDGGEVRTRENERFEPQLVREAAAVPIPDAEGAGIGSIGIEQFLEEGADADHWLDLTFFPAYETKAEYLDDQPELAELNPLGDGETFHRMGPRGTDYLFSGALDVDLMLADLASILYPELLEDHELEFLGYVPAD